MENSENTTWWRIEESNRKNSWVVFLRFIYFFVFCVLGWMSFQWLNSNYNFEKLGQAQYWIIKIGMIYFFGMIGRFFATFINFILSAFVIVSLFLAMIYLIILGIISK